jgi:hypothetical protein
MRLWSLHPKYLDAKGLVALWRESLLAQAVLRGETRGYRHHPQLLRFQTHATPLSAMNAYLSAVHVEATARQYAFDRRKIGPRRPVAPILVNDGQLAYEWNHLLHKLSVRAPELHHRWRDVAQPECHPLFRLTPGGIEAWERPD